VRFLLGALPILYMKLIWLQSSKFNPESIYALSTSISKEILLVAGISFELFHFFEFGILYLLLSFVFLSFGKFTKRVEVLLMFISFSYGFIDEIHQMYVPFRSFSLDDLVKDGIGVLVISLIIHKSYFSKKRSKIGSFLKGLENISDKKRNISL